MGHPAPAFGLVVNGLFGVMTGQGFVRSHECPTSGDETARYGAPGPGLVVNGLFGVMTGWGSCVGRNVPHLVMKPCQIWGTRTGLGCEWIVRGDDGVGLVRWQECPTSGDETARYGAPGPGPVVSAPTRYQPADPRCVQLLDPLQAPDTYLILEHALFRPISQNLLKKSCGIGLQAGNPLREKGSGIFRAFANPVAELFEEIHA